MTISKMYGTALCQKVKFAQRSCLEQVFIPGMETAFRTT